MKLGPRQTQWVEALESGEYEQCKGVLHKVDGFCCLGVACDLSGLAEWDAGGAYLYRDETLPDEVWEHYGFHSRTGGDPMQRGKPLLWLNDNGKSFTEIAAYIRAHPERVFKESK